MGVEGDRGSPCCSGADCRIKEEAKEEEVERVVREIGEQLEKWIRREEERVPDGGHRERPRRKMERLYEKARKELER